MRERSPIVKKNLVVYPSKKFWKSCDRPYPTLSSKCGNLQPDIAQPCGGQLTAVLTGFPLTGIPWPYRGLRCRPMEVTWVFEVIRWYVSTVELPLPATSPQRPLFLALRTVHTLTFVFPKTSLKRQRSLKGVPNCQNRDLKQLLWRRQRQRQNTIGFMTKKTALHVHHAVWYISLTSTARLQRQSSQSDVLQRTWTYDEKFSFLYLNMDKALKN